MTESARLRVGEIEMELPVVVGSEGERALDIRELRKSTGLITLDPGYANTASCESAITFVDGERGVLRYRGIPIEQFENAPNFVEVAWLLIFGQLPTHGEYARFSAELTDNANLDEGMKHHFEGFPRSAPPMAILSAMINALSCFHPEFFELEDPDRFEGAAARLISKVRTLAAYAYRSSRGLPYIYPDPQLPYAVNLLHMMFSQPYRRYECAEVVRTALNLLFILHADHEQNCSTSTVRMVGSSRANLFASCAAGVCALWGPLHGGANVKVVEMLQAIHDGQLTPEDYVRLAQDKSSHVRLMGFGHRIYKSFDPRATLLRRVVERLFAESGLRTRCSTSPAGWRQSPSKTPTLCSASSTPMWTSTAASSCAPSASPPTCSRCSSPSAACPGGSHTGMSRALTREGASTGLAKSTPAPPSTPMYR